MSSAHIQVIIFTGIITILFIIGAYLILMSRVKLEGVMGKVFGIRDMEITTGMVVFTKVSGCIILAISLLIAWKIFF